MMQKFLEDWYLETLCKKTLHVFWSVPQSRQENDTLIPTSFVTLKLLSTNVLCLMVSHALK